MKKILITLAVLSSVVYLILKREEHRNAKKAEAWAENAADQPA